MDRIQTQASELWDLLFAKETANTYQSALSLTGDILKESAQLVWLVICSFFVFGAWFGDASVKTGKGVRDWIDQKDVSVPSSAAAPEIAAQKSKSLLDTGRESIAAALSKAREELGLDPNAPLAAPREDSPVAKLVTPSDAPSSTTSTTSSSTGSESSAPSSAAAPSSSTATEPSPTATDDSSPSAGAATARPASSEGQNIGSSYASSRGSGSAATGFGSESFADRTPGSQSGGPQSSKYDNQDFDDDPEDGDESEDSSWPPQTAEE
ncbi:MAG: hypothetical protein WA947_09925 [Phormidesmis sp.]